MPTHRLVVALQDLRKREIDFVLVGGLAAVLNGAPVQTYDIDLVHARDPSNIQRLLGFLADADAVFRIQPERRLRPSENHLAGGDHLNLMTHYGPLDLRGTIGRGLDYAALLPHSKEIEVGEGTCIRVLDLETIIAVKEQLAAPKDLAVLPILYATLRESGRRGR